MSSVSLGVDRSAHLVTTLVRVLVIISHRLSRGTISLVEQVVQVVQVVQQVEAMELT